jgi:gluconolactonase
LAIFMLFASGLKNPEGPVSLPDETWLVVEGGADRGCITWLSSDGTQARVVAKTGRPNGLAVDHEGRIWVAESQTPSLLCVTLEGKIETVATGCEGQPFLFPNDLCFGPDGAIYMTDSGVHIEEFAPNNVVRADYESVHYDGRVYRIDPANGNLMTIDSGIKFANGIAFDAAGQLYVNETVSGAIYRYAWSEGAASPRKELFGNVVDPTLPRAWRGPDGMAFDADGRLYVAVFGQGDATVLDTDGKVVNRIQTAGNLPTNLAFARNSQKRLYVTEYEFGTVEILEVSADGLALWDGSA